MSWFKKKEKCAVVGCQSFEADYRDQLTKESDIEVDVCFGCHEKIKDDVEKFVRSIKQPEKPSDIDHVLWLMDKFPVEDFELRYFIGEGSLYFKGICLKNNSYHSFIKDFAPIEKKLLYKKEQQRQAVLNEIADERIASKTILLEPGEEIKFADTCTREYKTKPVTDYFKENKSVKKAYKRKARVKSKSKKTAG